jgi:8-oxo-dGTP diphosphatase
MINKTNNNSAITDVNRINWDTWKAQEEAVLCFIMDGNRLWLIHKKTGLGKGKINAPGGRIEPGESAIDAAIRETWEETGLIPSSLTQAEELSFVFTDGYSLHGIVFFASGFSGTPVETFEAKPFWCPVDAIPYDQMWQDDRLWLPLVLQKIKVHGFFIFDGDRMVSYRIVDLHD